MPVIEFERVQAMAGEFPARSDRRRRSRGTAIVAASKRERVSEANDDIGFHEPPPKATKRPRYADVEEPEEEPALETSSERALSPVRSNTPKTQYAEEHNVLPTIIVSTFDSDLYQLFGYCSKCYEGGEAADWHLHVSGFPCRRQELQDAFRTGNASGVAKSLHRFMGGSLQHGKGRHWGVNVNHSSIWIEEYRRRLLPLIGKLTNMGTYDCLSLAYRLLLKLKDLPQEPHLDEMRRTRNQAGDVTHILLLPQDYKIDFMLHTVIKKRATNSDKWAWEHDLAALNNQASLLTQTASTQWFSHSRHALSDLGKQREGLMSEFFEPLPGFQYALALDRGALGVRKGVHCACCADQVDEVA